MTAPTAATRLPIHMTTPLVAVGYGETAYCRWHEEIRGGEVVVVYKPVPRPVMCVGVRAMRGGTLFFVGSQAVIEGGALVMYCLEGYTPKLHVGKCSVDSYMYMYVCFVLLAYMYGLHVIISKFSLFPSKCIHCLCFPWCKRNRPYRNLKMYVQCRKGGGVIDKVSIRYSQ